MCADTLESMRYKDNLNPCHWLSWVSLLSFQGMQGADVLDGYGSAMKLAVTILDHKIHRAKYSCCLASKGGYPHRTPRPILGAARHGMGFPVIDPVIIEYNISSVVGKLSYRWIHLKLASYLNS